MTTPITIRGLRKHFGLTRAVDGIDLDIPGGDLFFLLGPSGCGKTTLLRMIAGFSDPDAGSIAFGPQDVTHLPPNERNTGMVFQGYALWPHMTVRGNVAFGLEVRKVPKKMLRDRVDQALDAVQLTHEADRKINQLSGGQQQRVALARALVIQPTVLLLDEPLSNLDAKLRLTMRASIRQVCKQASITAVYVTHDQDEALSMADHVAILDAGKIVQTGPPRKLYKRPDSRFVADFLGDSNFVTAKVTALKEDRLLLDSPAGLLHAGVFPTPAPEAGSTVTCSVRPEAVRFVRERRAQPEATDLPNQFAGVLLDTVYLGELAQHRLRVLPEGPGTTASANEGMELRAFELNPPIEDAPNLPVRATVHPDDVVVLAAK